MEAVCRPLLIDHEGKDHAVEVDSKAPHCQCDQCALGPHGVVAPNEFLVRLIISPFDVHKKRQNEVIPSAISAAETSGLSSFREGFVSNEELVKTARERVDHIRKTKPKAGVFGVLRMLVADVRAVRPAEAEGIPPYCVYDVPDNGIDAHVDVLQRMAGVDEGLPALRRHWMFEKVGPTFIPVAAYRNGLLVPFAPIP